MSINKKLALIFIMGCSILILVPLINPTMSRTSDRDAFNFTGDKLLDLEHKAYGGDGVAAFELSQFYYYWGGFMEKNERKRRMRYWLEMGINLKNDSARRFANYNSNDLFYGTTK